MIEIGKVDMTESLTSDSNNRVINKVLRYGKSPGIMVFIIHGFWNSGEEEWLKDLMKALSDKYENEKDRSVVVGVVDWRWGKSWTTGFGRKSRLKIFNFNRTKPNLKMLLAS